MVREYGSIPMWESLKLPEDSSDLRYAQQLTRFFKARNGKTNSLAVTRTKATNRPQRKTGRMVTNYSMTVR